MQKRMLQINCVNNHEAPNLCTKETCRYPSPICQDKQCQYSKKHQNCLTTTRSNVLIECLLKKQSLLGKETDELILGLIQKLIKALEILRQQYLARDKNFLIKLKDIQRQVFELIERKEIKQLKPALVFNTIKSLSDNNNKEQKNKLINMKQIINEVDKSVEKQLNKVRKLMNIPQVAENTKNPQSYSFSKQFCVPNQMKISNQGKIIEITQYNPNYSFSMITPSLSFTSNKKIRLKIRNLSNLYLYFGVARKAELLESMFTYRGNGSGVHIVSSHGRAFNCKSLEQYDKLLGFEVCRGEEIQMEYISNLMLLKITNLSTDAVVVLRNITDQFNDLHYVIQTTRYGQEVEIIK